MNASDFERELDAAWVGLRAMLIAKNKAYNDSALQPLQVYSTAKASDGIRQRLDDKLKRIAFGDAAGEDCPTDFLGYLVLLAIAEIRESVDDALKAASEARKAYSIGQAHHIVNLTKYGGGQGGGQ